MKNLKLISFLLIIVIFSAAVFMNFSAIKKSFGDLTAAGALLKTTQSSISIDPNTNSSLSNLLTLRSKMSLVSFDKEDLSIFQKFFPTVLEKKYGLSNIVLTITKQYSSLNNKKIFNCNIKFKGNYTQFLKALNDNFPLIFVNNYQLNNDVSSADIYGYVTDLSGDFVFDSTVKAYSLFEQIGVISDGNTKVFDGAITYTKDGITYFLKDSVVAHSYLVCSNVVKFLQTTDSSKTFLILPIKDDLSIQG